MKICVFGFGKNGKSFVEATADYPEIICVCYCDNNPKYWDTKDAKGRPVYKVAEVVSLLNDNLIDGVYISGKYPPDFRIPMILQLREMNVKPEQIFTDSDDASLLLVPVYSTGFRIETDIGNAKVAIYLDNINDFTARFIHQLTMDCSQNAVECIFFTHDMGLVGCFIGDIEIISIYRTIREYSNGNIGAIIFSLSLETLKLSYLIKNYILSLLNTEHVYFTQQELCKKPYLVQNDLDKLLINDHRLVNCQRINIMMTDRCNLYCVNCSFCTGLLKKHWDYESAKYRKDLERLYRLLACEPRSIVLIGGEPLLHGDLAEMLYHTRDVFRYSEIRIITNGLLMKKADSTLISAIRLTDTVIEFSFYPPLRASIDDIISFCKSNGIMYDRFSEKTSFYTLFSLNPKNNPAEVWQHCIWSCCATVKDGVISKCNVPFALPVFNDYYGMQIPIDIEAEALAFRSTDTNREMILDLLSRPSDICRYCSWEKTQTQDWQQINSLTNVDDWLCE